MFTLSLLVFTICSFIAGFLVGCIVNTMFSKVKTSSVSIGKCDSESLSIKNVDGDITVNKKKVHTKSNVLSNLSITATGKVLINGVEQLAIECKEIDVEISGDCENVDLVSGSVNVEGTVNGDVSTVSGEIKFRDVVGNVSTVSGDIQCDNIIGNVDTTSGDVTSDVINGKVETLSGNINGKIEK